MIDLTRTSLGWTDEVSVRLPLVRVKISDLIEILNGAVEQSIGYWVERSRDIKHLRAPLFEGSEKLHSYVVEISVRPEEDDKWYSINVQTVVDGLLKALDPKVKLASVHREQAMTVLTRGVDEADLDADSYDVFVQLGIFGEIVYG